MTFRRSMIASAATLLLASAPPLAAQPAAKPAPAPASTAATAPTGSFDAARLRPILDADYEHMPSGCSFAAKRGKEVIAVSIDDAPSANKTVARSFWFKLDGKLVEAKGKSVRTKPNDQFLGVWTGLLDGRELRVVEGKAGKGTTNDGGGSGGVGTLEWGAPGAGGKLAIRWEAGC